MESWTIFSVIFLRPFGVLFQNNIPFKKLSREYHFRNTFFIIDISWKPKIYLFQVYQTFLERWPETEVLIIQAKCITMAMPTKSIELSEAESMFRNLRLVQAWLGCKPNPIIQPPQPQRPLVVVAIASNNPCKNIMIGNRYRLGSDGLWSFYLGCTISLILPK